MVVSEGKLISKNHFGGQNFTSQLRAYQRTVDDLLIKDFTRGVAVNTDYLSNIQVRTLPDFFFSFVCSGEINIAINL